ncbi:unnamed protein product [Rotaria sp. Silwood1]|nr:unnamed protein product [Rotaria sp. Silwood1]CAF0960360.1 unnamed protein product [Rotaria sp. Silwood1]CAF3347343.1 unnamed protein product [Rotaria sp. Silwood1]CAF3371331.1 unnamed protein product [Rotaria sp. Silwood1]CAF4526727.1 unnamed protein product [Rotaria sp. Silwood1]
MSAYNIRNPVRCFCSFVAKHTNDNIFVCGRYKSGSMVCLFHLHDENLEHYYQTNSLPLSFDCEMCLATIKIHSKEYIAPCRLPSVRCHCGDVATFYQSKKENVNNNTYFFGCPNWKTIRKCNFFVWAHEHLAVRNEQVLHRLTFPTTSKNQINSEQSCKGILNQDHDEINQKEYEELRKQLECVICLSGERCCLISPCNHLCCCATCAKKIQNHCPICRGDIESIQRIFFV